MLGYGIVFGSLIVKMPQIWKLMDSQSGAGLNIYSILLELSAITLNLAYSHRNEFPFSSWGDVAFLAIQTAIIASLVIYYNHNSRIRSYGFLAIYWIVALNIIYQLPTAILWSMQAVNIPILLSAKFSQAYTNYSNGNTGQLSAVTCFMLFFGSMARIFTSIQETGDTLLILTYILSTLSNGVIVAQLLYYWNTGADGKKKATKDKPTKAKGKAKAKKAD